jgi:hypothetical protein
VTRAGALALRAPGGPDTIATLRESRRDEWRVVEAGAPPSRAAVLDTCVTPGLLGALAG